MIDRKKLIRTMDSLGYRESMKGTSYFREAIMLLDANPRSSMYYDIYPGVAAAVGATPARVERAMRAATEVAMESPTWDETWKELGGWGEPTSREIVFRLARELKGVS